MKKFTLNDLDDLAIGAAILGSGGGGETLYPYMMARQVMEKYGTTNLLSPSELKPNDFIVPIGMIGAPLAEIEKIANGDEFSILIKLLEETVGRKVTAIMPFEIGGGNAFTPFWIAPILGLPILDADAMGRAFPESQMSSVGLLEAPCSPGVITDPMGNSVVIYPNSCFALEKISRQTTIAMGSWACSGMYPLNAEQAKTMTFQKSITRALSIGKAYRESKQMGKDPLGAILSSCKGVLIGSGKITDIDRAISKGFLKGHVIIQNKNTQIEILIQNEFLLAKVNGKVVATTPDILGVIEMETGQPITSDTLQYGLKVNLIAIPSPPLWTTPKGLSLVGPRHFGYEIDYIPFSKIKPPVNDEIGVIT